MLIPRIDRSTNFIFLVKRFINNLYPFVLIHEILLILIRFYLVNPTHIVPLLTFCALLIKNVNDFNNIHLFQNENPDAFWFS